MNKCFVLYRAFELSFDKILGVDIESSDAEPTGVDTAQCTGVDTDPNVKPTGVEEDAYAYRKPYDAVPQ